MTALAVIKSSKPPANLTEVEDNCAAIEAWADTCTAVPELKDASNKLSAIDEYLGRTSIEGRARVAAAMRHLDVRIGELLGPAEHGGARTAGQVGRDQLEPRERHDFRKMAAHPDVVEQVIEESSDASPPSRRKVLGAIEHSPRRRPLIDEMRRAVMTLNAAALRVDGLSQDNRFNSNRSEISHQFKGDVLRIADVLWEVATRMETE
jgi:hypothetical protein